MRQGDFWTGVHASSENDGWCTPPKILGVVRQIGPIVLDPCTNEENPVGAEVFFTPRTDGLSQDWRAVAGDGLIFVNWPYGPDAPLWAAKCRNEAQKGCRIVALPPARTDTAWWQDYVVTCQAVCFWRGRITFVGAPAPAPFPSAFPYWGPDIDNFIEVFSPYGWTPRT